MEEKKIFCSFKEHTKINAKSYCDECKLYMCNKCENFHSNFHQNHKYYDLKNISDIFTGFCKEENHNNKLRFFCKTHNQLCCVECIANINGKNLGKHKNCKISFIEDIKDEIMNKLKDNIKYLEEFSINIKESINNLKTLFEKINKDKEELKMNIQKIFTNLRNKLNNREDELLYEVDKKYDELFFQENIIKVIEKLPNEIIASLEKGKILEKGENINELNELINDCLNIENNIKKINLVDVNVKKCNKSSKIKINFLQEKEEEINNFIKNIKSFGQITVKIDLKNDLKLSSIIKDDMYINKIIEWIGEKVKKKNIEFELKFKMSVNGYTNKDFYKYCENIGPSLTLIKTTKNKIFGGFTPLKWSKGVCDLFDKYNQTFIFSLNLMKKYDMLDKEKKKAIYCSDSYGSCFGDCDFALKADMKKGETYANNYSNFLSNNNLELTGGKCSYENFDAEEFELYKVIY